MPTIRGLPSRNPFTNPYNPATDGATAAPAQPTSLMNKWYNLSDQMAAGTQNQQLSQLGSKGNAQLNTGLSGLGFRGNNNYGSMERLAGANTAAQAVGGQGVGQSRYNKMAELYGQGLQNYEIPSLIGKDQAAAMKNAAKDGDMIGNFITNLGF